MTPPPGNVRAVIFDLDGTLYTVSGLAFHIAVGMLGSLCPLRNLFSVRDEMRSADYGDRDTFKKVFAEKMAARCGMTAEGALSWYEDRFMPRFTYVLGKHAKLRAGLIPVLAGLRLRGVKTAVVSDFGWVKERLTALRVSPALFDETLGAEEFGVMKPTAKPFQFLVQKWGIAPTETILVGDRADHDQGSATLLHAIFWGIESKRNRGEDFDTWPNVRRALEGVGQLI